MTGGLVAGCVVAVVSIGLFDALRPSYLQRDTIWAVGMIIVTIALSARWIVEAIREAGRRP